MTAPNRRRRTPDEIHRALSGLFRGDERAGRFPVAHLLRDQRALPEALLVRLVDDATELRGPRRGGPSERVLVTLRLDTGQASEPVEVDDASSLLLGVASFRRVGRVRDGALLTLTYERVES